MCTVHNLRYPGFEVQWGFQVRCPKHLDVVLFPKLLFLSGVLPCEIKLIQSTTVFKTTLKTHLFKTCSCFFNICVRSLCMYTWQTCGFCRKGWHVRRVETCMCSWQFDHPEVMQFDSRYTKILFLRVSKILSFDKWCYFENEKQQQIDSTVTPCTSQEHAPNQFRGYWMCCILYMLMRM